jgi:hypothetical protein
MLDALLIKLETDLRAAFDESLTGLVATARTQLDAALAVCEKGLVEVAREKTDLRREIATMHKHKEAQVGRVELNVGGYRFETSVQTLRRLPHTFFDAYFSGQYAQDVCADGSIFIDRDGEHFGQVLQYLRDGVVLVAEHDASNLDISMLRLMKREFGFYCIELMAVQQEVAFAVSGADFDEAIQATIEHYDVVSDEWREGSPMATARKMFALCGLGSELYAIGGFDAGNAPLASVERYNPSLDTWSAAPPMPRARAGHCVASVGDTMYVIGGVERIDGRCFGLKTVLKFDSRTKAWSEVAPMPEPRAYAGACKIGNNIYFLGGTGPLNSIPATTCRYNIDTDVWSTLAPIPEAKKHHGICALGGLIYVLGGRSNDIPASSSVHHFNPDTNSWSAVAPMSTPRYACASFVLNGSVHVAGGWNGRQQSASTERYNVASDTWSYVGAMNQARDSFSAHVMQVEFNLFDSLVLKGSLHSAEVHLILFIVFKHQYRFMTMCLLERY